MYHVLSFHEPNSYLHYFMSLALSSFSWMTFINLCILLCLVKMFLLRFFRLSFFFLSAGGASIQKNSTSIEFLDLRNNFVGCNLSMCAPPERSSLISIRFLRSHILLLMSIMIILIVVVATSKTFYFCKSFRFVLYFLTSPPFVFCASRGYKRFFRRAVLETSDFLKNDTLAIICTVGVVVSSTQGPNLYFIPLPEPDLGTHFGSLLDSGEGADVTFEVDGEVYQAHKLVLAARSPVFKVQLYGPTRDHNAGTIKIEDIEAPVFKVREGLEYILVIIYSTYLSNLMSINLDSIRSQHSILVRCVHRNVVIASCPHCRSMRCLKNSCNV